jgi:hypothetical protein
MLHIAIVVLGLCASDPSPVAPDSPEALIRRALEFEAQGLDDRKRECLEAVLRVDPENSRARGLLGQVSDHGLWLTVGQSVEKAREDAEQSALLAEYERRRAEARDTPAAQWKLALWCEQNGLPAEATAHFSEVTRLDPDNRAAWKKLGCRLYRGRWQSEEQIATQEAEFKAQAEADRHWGPRLARWKSRLLDPTSQAEATRDLSQVREPRAVPSIVRVFDGAPRWQRWAVYLLGRIDSPGSAQALASLAVRGVDEAVRETAIDRLRPFDPRAYVGLLINWVGQPTRYEVVGSWSGRNETTVLIDTPGAEIERHYLAVATTRNSQPGTTPPLQGDRVARLQSNGHYALFDRQVRVTPTRGTADEAEVARNAVAERVRADLREIDQANEPIEERDVRVLHTLYQVTGKTFGADQQAWTTWWNDQLGYRYGTAPSSSKPLVTQEIATPYVPPPPRIIVTQTLVHARPHSCFAAGTPVLTRSGLRPIEQVTVGDQVLSQDTTTGTISFQPVLASLHNPPSTVIRLTLANGEQIDATDIHRFWRAGKGWTMTRELKPGDRLRAAGGSTEIVDVARRPTQRVYNLEVARNADFFVGRSGVLVHDATLVPPQERAFDRITAADVSVHQPGQVAAR